MITIKPEHILLNQKYQDYHEAISATGDFLVGQGLVEPAYTQSMRARQDRVSVYIGNFVALPHGDFDGKAYVIEEGVCLIQVPDGVNFGTEAEPKVATILFVVVLKEEQLATLQEIAFFCSEIDNVMALSDAKTKEDILALLAEAL